MGAGVCGGWIVMFLFPIAREKMFSQSTAVFKRSCAFRTNNRVNMSGNRIVVTTSGVTGFRAGALWARMFVFSKAGLLLE